MARFMVGPLPESSKPSLPQAPSLVHLGLDPLGEGLKRSVACSHTEHFSAKLPMSGLELHPVGAQDHAQDSTAGSLIAVQEGWFLMIAWQTAQALETSS